MHDGGDAVKNSVLPKHQGGYSLIEVMIAILILGIGLLGIAALQAMALRNNQSSIERGQAVIQSYAYLDILRANRAEAITTNGVLSIPSLVCDANSINAESKPLAYQWMQDLQSVLGSDSCAKATCAASSDNAYLCTVTVQWDDSRAQGGSAAQQIVMETLL